MGESYTYDTSISDTSGAEAAVAGAFLVAFIVIALISYVIYAIFLSQIFKKAGVEGWKAWVPVYNQWVFFELGGQKGWLSLLSLLVLTPLGSIPFFGLIPALVSYVYSVIAAYKIGLSLGKEGVFVLLYIFLPIVWFIWLAVDKSAIWRGTGDTQAVAHAATPATATYQPQQPSSNDTTPPKTPSQPTSL